MDVEDFGTRFGRRLPEGDYVTIGGFVFHELGELPEVGAVVRLDGLQLTVAAVEGRRITELRVQVDEPAGEPEPGTAT
jgi:Mg2+/Co2+ transporter CorC